MASKIIKQGTSRSLEIQQFLFSEDCLELSRIPEQVQWPELTAVPPLQQKSSTPAEPFKPEVDNKLIEKSAFENGFRQGEQSGMAMAEQKMEAIMKRHAETILEIGRMKSSLYAQVELEVAKLAIEVAKKIIYREIQVDPNIIQTLIRVTLANVAAKNPVTVRVNPIDFNYISERQAEQSQTEARNISIVPDKSIERGGCLVETDCGDIDARLEEKFREVEHSFFEGAY
jgi:flagellar assembly protein FliH